MSEDNKNLQDDLNEMLGDAKEGAKKAADKASEMASEAKQKISQFTEEAKERTKEFREEAQQAADEFTEDADKVFSDGKNIAIIAHLTFIGWIIALVMNSSNKTEMGSFYIRQMLGLMVLSLVGLIPVVGWILSLIVLLAWLMSLVSAFSGQMKPSFLFGAQFQEWFKTI
jgi:ElaB/YqjD/DUF883 family membrane-anchored ribosome-binding protein